MHGNIGANPNPTIIKPTSAKVAGNGNNRIIAPVNAIICPVRMIVRLLNLKVIKPVKNLPIVIPA